MPLVLAWGRYPLAAIVKDETDEEARLGGVGAAPPLDPVHGEPGLDLVPERFVDDGLVLAKVSLATL